MVEPLPVDLMKYVTKKAVFVGTSSEFLQFFYFSIFWWISLVISCNISRLQPHENFFFFPELP